MKVRYGITVVLAVACGIAVGTSIAHGYVHGSTDPGNEDDSGINEMLNGWLENAHSGDYGVISNPDTGIYAQYYFNGVGWNDPTYGEGGGPAAGQCKSEAPAECPQEN